jgi:streptogramin lyase
MAVAGSPLKGRSLKALLAVLLFIVPACRRETPIGPPDAPYLSGPTVFIPVGTLKSPRGIAVDATGDIWVADTYNDQILRFGSDGTEKASVPGFTLPRYMGIDRLTGDILTVENGLSIIRVDPTNNNASVETTLSELTIDTTFIYDVNLRQTVSRGVTPNEIGDIAGAFNGDIFVSVLANDTENFIVRVRNGLATAIAVSDQPPSIASDIGTRFLAVDNFGTVYTAFISGSQGSAAARVYALNPGNLPLSHFLSEPLVTGGARGAGIDVAGELYIADPPVNAMVIVSTTLEQTIDVLNIPAVEGMNESAAWDIGVGPDGSVYVAIVDRFDTANELGAVLKYTRSLAAY